MYVHKEAFEVFKQSAVGEPKSTDKHVHVFFGNGAFGAIAKP